MKNIVIFSEPRSGSSAITSLLINANSTYSKHDSMLKGYAEYLNCVPAFFPQSKYDGIVRWDDCTDQYYYNNDHESLTKYYEDNPPNKDDISLFPVLNDNQHIVMQAKSFNKVIFKKNFGAEEIDRRLKILQSAEAYCFKYFDYHIDYDSWIDRDNTITIVLVRNNILEKIASRKRQESTGIWHVQESETLNKLTTISKATTDDVLFELEQWNSFLDRVDMLNPDIIITYEWLVEKNILNDSNFKKVNTDGIDIFFEDYEYATELTTDMRNLETKNIDQLYTLLGKHND